MSDRRSFLRGLTTLPLIGGGVALLGQPTRVAQAASNEDLARYAAFSIREADLVMRRFQAQGIFHRFSAADAMERHISSFPEFETVALRAPIMLAAAGLPSFGGDWNG